MVKIPRKLAVGQLDFRKIGFGICYFPDDKVASWKCPAAEIDDDEWEMSEEEEDSSGEKNSDKSESNSDQESESESGGQPQEQVEAAPAKQKKTRKKKQTGEDENDADDADAGNFVFNDWTAKAPLANTLIPYTGVQGLTHPVPADAGIDYFFHRIRRKTRTAYTPEAKKVEDLVCGSFSVLKVKNMQSRNRRKTTTDHTLSIKVRVSTALPRTDNSGYLATPRYYAIVCFRQTSREGTVLVL